MRVSIGSDVLSAPIIEQPVMIFGHGKDGGRGRDFGGRGCGFVGGGRGSYGGNRVPLRKAPDNAGIVDIAITFSKCIGRNFNVVSGHII